MTTTIERRPESALFNRLSDWLDWDVGRFFDRARLGELIRIEEREVDGQVEIRAEMPGIDPDKDVDITVTDGYLTISAERREEEKGEREGTHFSEFRYGSFNRTLRVPSGTQAKDVKATYKDGILAIRLPKAMETKADVTKVPVSHS